MAKKWGLRYIFGMWLFILLAPLWLFSQEKKGVLTLSSAIVDHVVEITDDEIPSAKGSWSAISLKALLAILQQFEGRVQTIPGGSGVNVAKAMARMGTSCRVIGRIGDDSTGEEYVASLKKWGVTVDMVKGMLPTGRAICMITPDAGRTFKTYLGASHSLDPKITLNEQHFDEAHLIHIEGYQLIDHDLLMATLELAQRKGITVSLDLANYKIVESHKEQLLEILPKYVDILFCNEIESYALTGLDPEMAVKKLASWCDIAVVTMSERGCYACEAQEMVYVPAHCVKAVDTTGAGDSFTAGFLSGYCSGQSLLDRCRGGTLVASHAVQVIGAEIPENRWEIILKELKGLFQESGALLGHSDALQTITETEAPLD